MNDSKLINPNCYSSYTQTHDRIIPIAIQNDRNNSNICSKINDTRYLSRAKLTTLIISNISIDIK